MRATQILESRKTSSIPNIGLRLLVGTTVPNVPHVGSYGGYENWAKYQYKMPCTVPSTW